MFAHANVAAEAWKIRAAMKVKESDLPVYCFDIYPTLCRVKDRNFNVRVRNLKSIRENNCNLYATTSKIFSFEIYRSLGLKLWLKMIRIYLLIKNCFQLLLKILNYCLNYLNLEIFNSKNIASIKPQISFRQLNFFL